MDDVASNEEAQGVEIPGPGGQAALPTLRNGVVQGMLRR
jgi:hypothetical protein